VQAAECSSAFYKQAFQFAVAIPNEDGKYPNDASVLGLRAQCKPAILNDQQLVIRQKLLDTLTLYADAIQTLTNGTSDTQLSTNSQKVASDIKTFATEQKFTSKEQEGAGALNAAVVAITALVLDHSGYKHVKDAAAAVKPQLALLVNALKVENEDDAKYLASEADGLINEMRTGLSGARDRLGPASFVDIVSAKVTLNSLVVAPPNVDQLNKVLDALVSANDALARSSNGGAIPEISDLISRAQQASTLFNAAK
jgi:hypothetical protein